MTRRKRQGGRCTVRTNAGTYILVLLRPHSSHQEHPVGQESDDRCDGEQQCRQAGDGGDGLEEYKLEKREWEMIRV